MLHLLRLGALVAMGDGVSLRSRYRSCQFQVLPVVSDTAGIEHSPFHGAVIGARWPRDAGLSSVRLGWRGGARGAEYPGIQAGGSVRTRVRKIGMDT